MGTIDALSFAVGVGNIAGAALLIRRAFKTNVAGDETALAAWGTLMFCMGCALVAWAAP